VIGAGNEMNDRELLEYIAAQVGSITGEVKNIKADMQRGFKNADDKLNKAENHIIRLENKLEEKTSVLFDGFNQLNSKLDRIETQVEKIEDFEVRISVLENK
jgi:DNA repair exonuclease SbcCD ATPase subunit